MKNMHRINRRTLIKSGAAAIAAPALLNANSASAQAKVIKIGHVSPKTGPLAGFGEADEFILRQVREVLARACRAAAGHIRFRSSPRTASRAAAAPRRSRPN